MGEAQRAEGVGFLGGVVPHPHQLGGLGSAVSSPSGSGQRLRDGAKSDFTQQFQVKIPADILRQFQLKKAGLVIPFHESVGNKYFYLLLKLVTA